MVSRTIDSRTRITEPGTYRLDSDIRLDGIDGLSEAFVRIESDDVVLDGQGYSLAGDGISDSVAVAVGASPGIRDVVVRDLRAVDWEIGLLFRNVDEATADGVRAAENSYGILFEGARGCAVEGCTVSENLVGVCLDSARDDVTVRDSRIDRSHLRDVLRERDSR